MHHSFRTFLHRCYWIISVQFGVDILRLCRGLLSLPLFIIDYRKFCRGYKGIVLLKPCLLDRYAEGGDSRSEYFWQDLLVAQRIFQAKPRRHVDVGSRFDGFVAHVAAFRHLEVIDIREVSNNVPNVRFCTGNIMDGNFLRDGLGQAGLHCDSLSCLHVLEHLGLGRYGDPLDPKGYAKGLMNLAGLLEDRGILYLSAPVGYQRVEFNANWVFAPETILSLAASNGLILQRVVGIDKTAGPLMLSTGDPPAQLRTLGARQYCLAVMEFEKRITLLDGPKNQPPVTLPTEQSPELLSTYSK